MNDHDRSGPRPRLMASAGVVFCALAGALLLGCAGDSLPPAAAPSSDRPATTTVAVTTPPTTVPPTTASPATDVPATDVAATDVPATEPPPTEPAATPNTPAADVDPEAVDPSGPDLSPSASDDVPSARQPSYPTLEDGSPVPIVAIFDGDTIALSGTAPSQAASDRLETLAIANSAVPNAGVINFLTINPDVPISVGVRVIEMQSVRFGESRAVIVPEHATQLDRAVAVMNALPNISVVVIGHADQRGDPARNYEISADRAQSVVDYMAGQGIDPSRLAARAVGATDLLTLNDDAVAFELNRRTEFIFYGLLVE